MLVQSHSQEVMFRRHYAAPQPPPGVEAILTKFISFSNLVCSTIPQRVASQKLGDWRYRHVAIKPSILPSYALG